MLKKILIFIPVLIILINTSVTQIYSQVSSQDLKVISKILEIKKELYFLDIDSPKKLEELNRIESYFSGLFDNDSAITKPTVKFLFKYADISFYKFSTFGRSEYPWIKIFSVDSLKQLFVLDDEIKFYNDLCKTIELNDSLKLLYVSKIYEKINVTLHDIKIPNSANKLPFYNWSIEKEYFKVNPKKNGYYYKSYFEEITENSTDTYEMNFIFENDQLRVNKRLHKRIPK